MHGRVCIVSYRNCCLRTGEVRQSDEASPLSIRAASYAIRASR